MATEEAKAEEAKEEQDTKKQEIVDRVEQIVSLFEEDLNGEKVIQPEDAGPCLRSCGVFVPEIILVQRVMPRLIDEEMSDLRVVDPQRMRKIAVTMINERTWEPDIEDELLQAFRKIDRQMHHGQEMGYLEADAFADLAQRIGTAPFKKEESESFLVYSQDTATQRIYYHDYVGKLLPELDDLDSIFPKKKEAGWKSNRKSYA